LGREGSPGEHKGVLPGDEDCSMGVLLHNLCQKVRGKPYRRGRGKTPCPGTGKTIHPLVNGREDHTLAGAR
jgi:hypothetical protein